MKKIVLAIFMVAISATVFAQNMEVQTASNHLKYLKLDKAKVSIDKAAVHPKTQNSPKMYMLKGKIYLAIALDTTGAYNDINKDAIFISEKAFQDALTNKDSRTDEGFANSKLLFDVYNEIWRQGYNHAKSDEFADASKCFGACAVLKEGFDMIDTLGYLYAGNMAAAAENYDQAIEYFEKIKSTGYDNGVAYNRLATAYKKKSDTAQALVILTEGIELYPSNEDLLTTQLNIYIAQGETEKALAIIDKTIEANPENSLYWFTRGILKRDIDDLAGAEIDYLKALELDSTNSGIYEELGAMYVNKSNGLIDEKNNLPLSENKKYDALEKEINELYSKAVPYLEKAHELNPDNLQVKDTLMQIYLRKSDMDSYNKLKNEGVTE